MTSTAASVTSHLFSKWNRSKYLSEVYLASLYKYNESKYLRFCINKSFICFLSYLLNIFSLLSTISKCFISGLSLEKSPRTSNSLHESFQAISLCELASHIVCIFIFTKFLKKLSHLALTLIALIHFITDFSTSIRTGEIFLKTKFSPWITVHTRSISGFSFFLNFKQPFFLPIITGANISANIRRNICSTRYFVFHWCIIDI